MPVASPVTTPVVTATGAISGALLVQVPPVGVQLRVVVSPKHTFVAPVISPGSAYTVAIVVRRQPVGSVYEITDVPAASPVRVPAASIVLINGEPLAHMPPKDVLLRVVVCPIHVVGVPVIVAGNGLTEATAVN